MGEPAWQRLGFEQDDVVAIVHCDDLGMCHATNVGGFEALDNGPATCGSVMVPCPWFMEAAAMARERPQVDLGVHLTLNAEWTGYRWGPVADAAAVPSLLDDQGYLPRTGAETLARARPDEVRRELRAQVERALEAGIDVTHLDAHMGTAFFSPFLDAYLDLALEFRLPLLALRPDPRALAGLPDPGAGEAIRRGIERIEAGGVPILDHLDADSLSFAPGQGEAHNAARLDGLRPGLNYLICHPARAGEELSAIAPEAHCRDFERSFYGGEAGRRALEERGIRTLGMRALRELMRGDGS